MNWKTPHILSASQFPQSSLRIVPRDHSPDRPNRFVHHDDGVAALGIRAWARWVSITQQWIRTEEITHKRVAGGACLVAVDGNELIGTVMLYEPGRTKGCPWYEQPEVAIIAQFGVRPDRQGRGIGTCLLREAEVLGISIGATELALDTSEGADHLIAWYERKGFRFIEYTHWEGKTYRSVIMSKKLQQSSSGPIR